MNLSLPFRAAFSALIAVVALPAAAAGPTDPAKVSQIVRALASDDFQGRAPGTPGEAKTVAYLTDQFRKLGLEPAGENGGYSQTVPMIRTQIEKGAAFAVAAKDGMIPLRFPDDIYISTTRDVTRAAIKDAPMVFVGYGVSAPERGWDDFKGVDLKGKVAVFLINDPDFEAAPGEPVAGKFGGKSELFYGRWVYKFEEAARRGAIGALIVHETDGAGYGWNVVQSAGGENYDIVRPAGAQEPVLLAGWMQRPVAVDLFRRAGLDFEAVKRQARTAAFRPIDLGARFTAEAGVHVDHIQSRNLLAKISGTARPAETIFYGAHWDAYGLGAPDAQGRRMRPGALDDGTGIAGLLEIARAFKAGPPPQRTIVFAAWTAEERGLLGSQYYASNPLFPLDKTVANLTMDTLQPVGPTHDVTLIGQGQSELEDDLARVAAAQGRVLSSESHSERGMFYRADHFPFAKQGVPVLLVMALASGPDLVVGGKAAGEQWIADYTGHCYHQTCDSWHADWDLRGAAQDIDLLYTIGRDLANSNRWPAWKTASEFKATRDATAASRN